MVFICRLHDPIDGVDFIGGDLIGELDDFIARDPINGLDFIGGNFIGKLDDFISGDLIGELDNSNGGFDNFISEFVDLQCVSCDVPDVDSRESEAATTSQSSNLGHFLPEILSLLDLLLR